MMAGDLSLVTNLLVVVVVVVVDSHVQCIVLATKETTVTQQVSHRLIKCQSACGHKEVRKSTVHIMVTTRYSDQQESKSVVHVGKISRMIVTVPSSGTHSQPY